MARPYEEVVDTSYLLADPDLKKFADALRVQIQAEYQEIFGLGEVVAQRREELHLSQDQLAEKSGVSQGDICRLERGKGNQTLTTINKIMNALELKLAVKRLEPNERMRLRTL